MNEKNVKPQGPFKASEAQVILNFPCPVYVYNKPEFLETVNSVSEEYLQKQHSQRKINDIYPVMMTENYANDFRMKEFAEFVGGEAWDALNNQGYAMDHFSLFFESMWTQEHYKQSSMEQHVHGQGAQIVGFYFLEVPDNSSRVLFHDPRAGKVFCDLPEKSSNDVTIASQMINFIPKPGMLLFANAWLPHSFTRNESDKPLKFAHFNLAATPQHKIGCQTCTVEVI